MDNSPKCQFRICITCADFDLRITGNLRFLRNYHIAKREWVPMHDLTGFQRDLLYTIAGLEGPHGLALKDELEEYYETEVHHGRLYPNLDTLVDKGMVEKSEKDQRTNLYTLTTWATELQARRDWEQQYIDIDTEPETIPRP